MINNHQRLQIRYALLALISSGNVSLFNSSIVDLSKRLLTEEMSGTDEKANYSAYVLNVLCQEKLDPDDSPYQDLDASFLDLHQNKSLDF